MMDFEKAIINAAVEVFPNEECTCCFLHLCQSMYRTIQFEVLQAKYNDPSNRDLKTNTHMLLTLVYIPLTDVVEYSDCSELYAGKLDGLRKYIAENYVVERPGRRRRRAAPPRGLHPGLWNQYMLGLDGSHKMNNVSEGWHNRFRLFVGKQHPDLYSAITKIQKEQADAEIILAELSLDRTVKAAPKNKWIAIPPKIQKIVSSYEEYVDDGGTLEYLRNLSYTIMLSFFLMCILWYGNISPRTAWGKLVTIIYALIGIPLMLVYLSTTGDVLARSFRRLYGKMCGVPQKNSGAECPCSVTVKVPITLCLILVLGYICCGAVLFHRLENWTMLEGSYFCFTSLGTIGFGDLIPGQHAEEVSLCACFIYILAGMALVAMCVSLVQEEASSILRLIGAAPMKTPPVYKRPLPVFHHNSLPRKTNFQRNTPVRRSMGAEPLVEYFVPRSVSEFDLSIAGDIPLFTNRIGTHQTMPNPKNNKAPVKNKEKMVTFEDELATRKNPLEDVFM